MATAEAEKTIQQLVEYTDSRGVAVRVDREASVIHGVKILGGCCGTGVAHLEYLVEH